MNGTHVVEHGVNRINNAIVETCQFVQAEHARGLIGVNGEHVRPIVKTALSFEDEQVFYFIFLVNNVHLIQALMVPLVKGPTLSRRRVLSSLMNARAVQTSMTAAS